MTDTAELVKRLDKAIAMDAPTASDYEWSELLAAAMDAKNAIDRLEAERDAAFLAGVKAGIGASVKEATRRNKPIMAEDLRALDPLTIAKEIRDAD